MRSSFVISFCALASLAIGCSSSEPDATATVTGTVSSATMRASSAIARTGDGFSQANDGLTPRSLRILISNKTNTCGSTHFASATMLDIAIRGESVGPGTYPIVDANLATPKPGEAEVDFNSVDGACKDLVAEAATGGSVVLDRVEINLTDPSASVVVGSVDLTFAGGHIVGKFDGVLCDAASTDPGPAPAFVCTP